MNVPTPSLPANVEQLNEDYSYSTGFGRGEQPDWIYDTTTGSGSITYQTAEGGRAKISTGTGSVGDGGKIRFGVSGAGPKSVDLDTVDVCVIETTVRATTRDFSEADNYLYFPQSSDQLQINRSTRNLKVVGDSITDYNLPGKSWTQKKITETLVIDFRKPVAYVITNGMISEVATTDLPDPTAEDFFITFVNFTTQDTTSDRECYLYHASVSAYTER